MYSVTVRGHMMIAHSLTGDVFGPAQRLHGATYIVDVEFRRPDLDADGIVIDIGRATGTVHGVLAELSYRNLDDEPAFAGRAIESVRVTLHESHIAAASFDGSLRATSH